MIVDAARRPRLRRSSINRSFLTLRNPLESAISQTSSFTVSTTNTESLISMKKKVVVGLVILRIDPIPKYVPLRRSVVASYRQNSMLMLKDIPSKNNLVSSTRGYIKSSLVNIALKGQQVASLLSYNRVIVLSLGSFCISETHRNSALSPPS